MIIICHTYHNVMVSKVPVPMNVSADVMMCKFVSPANTTVISIILTLIELLTVTGDRKNGVTSIKYRRPLQTNDVNDKLIPTDREVSIIAAIGPLNSKREANAHLHNGRDVNVDDIQINFSSFVSFFWYYFNKIGTT